MLGMAAGILIAFGAILAVFSPWRGSDDSHLQMHFTRVGEQQTLTLEDGSVITLNTGSQLMVDYSERNRRILLERGEAHFQVREEAGRPFTVDLGAQSVTAVATAFNIRKDPERYEVAVFEGAIALHGPAEGVPALLPTISGDEPVAILPGSGPHRLESGWVAAFDVSREAIMAFRPESIERFRDWRSGMLSFFDEPLYRVVRN